MEYPKSIQRLILEFSKLPGIGKRSAERFVFHLLKLGDEENESLSESIRNLKSSIMNCPICGSIDTISPCSICSDDKRDRKLLCVVEDIRDLFAMEKTGQYKGLYHVLGGAISPLDGIGPENLRINELMERIKGSEIVEVIVATASSVPGDTTSLYISRLLKPYGIKMTRIAFGLPVGSEIQNADENTLIRALQGRRQLE